MSPLIRIAEAVFKLRVQAQEPTHIVMSRKLYADTEEYMRQVMFKTSDARAVVLMVEGCLLCPHDGVPEDYCVAAAGERYEPDAD